MSVFFSPQSSSSAPTSLVPLDIPYNLRKRKADIEPTVETPLTKRFRKLNIRNSAATTTTTTTNPSRVSKRTASPARNILSGYNGNTGAAVNRDPWNLTPPPFQRPSSPPPAVMDVDETPYRIFVNDLDSSDDSDLESPAKNGKSNPIIFLSDVEREMSRIPMVVLKASSTSAGTGVTKLTTARASSGSSMDLILYRPLEKIVDDSGARRSVMEVKERFRMRSSGSAMDGIRSEQIPPVNPMMDQSMGQLGEGFTHSPMAFMPTTPPNGDPDAMVLDDL